MLTKDNVLVFDFFIKGHKSISGGGGYGGAGGVTVDGGGTQGK